MFFINESTVFFSAALERLLRNPVPDPRKHAVVCKNKLTGLNAAVIKSSDGLLKDPQLLIHGP